MKAFVFAPRFPAQTSRHPHATCCVGRGAKAAFGPVLAAAGATSTASAPSSSASSPAPYVRRSLAGQPVRELPDGSLLVPLVGPDTDPTLPFAVALQMERAGSGVFASTSDRGADNISTGSRGSSTDSLPFQQRRAGEASEVPVPPTFELHYLLEGRGKMCVCESHGEQQQQGDAVDQEGGELVQAGDAVLMSSDAARFGPRCGDAGGVNGGGGEQDHGRLARLVMLLPSEVFGEEAPTGPAAHTTSYLSVVSRWESWLSAPVAGELSEQVVSEILKNPAQVPPARVLSPSSPHDVTVDQVPAYSPALTAAAAATEAATAIMGPVQPSQQEPSWLRALFDLPVWAGYAARDALGGVRAAPDWLRAFVTLPVSAGYATRGALDFTGAGRPPVLVRALNELDTFQLPGQTNCLALAFDPLQQRGVPFTFGVEIFQAGHHTPPHVHPTAHELFFLLSGEGEGFCNGERFPVAGGDLVLFSPGSVHGIDVGPGAKMYCLEMMLPNEMFAEFVKRGQKTEMSDDDLCALNAIPC